MSDWLPKALFFLSLVVVSFLYGALAFKDRLFPWPTISFAIGEVHRLFSPDWKQLSLDTVRHDVPVETLLPDHVEDRLLLVTAVDEDLRSELRVIDRAGEIIHRLRPDCFAIWPDDSAFPEDRRPQTEEAAYLHGTAILPGGDVVTNFEHLSTIRVDPCGNVVWALVNLGHHSVHVSNTGEIWVGAERYIVDGDTGIPNHHAPLNDWTAQHIAPDGEILETISVIEVLRRNGLDGLLFMSTLENDTTAVEGDTQHLNDVEIYPHDMPSEIFSPGDIMLSLRNTNTVLVIDRETHEIKFRSTGQVLRHHDPDFIGNDRISVFDNFNFAPSPIPPPASRIVELDALTGEAEVVLAGDLGPDRAFFTHIMGDHQRLANGNILVTSSAEGRVLEFTREGDLAWRYSNRIADGRNGAIFNAEVLPAEMDQAFFETLQAECGNG